MNSANPPKLRVFLVEDDADLREEIAFGLTTLGFDISSYGDASGLYRELAVKHCDIVVIDVGLPGEDGFTIAQHLRANSTLGIVFLTARSTLDDRLRGLGLGADAYLVKPIDVRELAAILHAVDRRLLVKAETTPDVSLAANNKPITASSAGWSLSADGWLLRSPQASELALTDAERRFLKIMSASAGQLVERQTLIDAFAHDVDNYDPHRLDAVIGRLRKRTEQAGLGSLPLQSIRGAGYIFSLLERRLVAREDTSGANISET